MAKASDNPYPSMLVVEGTAPTSPAAGQQRVYIDSADHKFKRVNSSGTVTTIEGGTGVGVSTVSVSRTTNQSLTTTAADLTGLAVTITADGTHRWKVTFWVSISNTTAGATGCNVKLLEGATVLQQCYQTLVTGQYLMYAYTWIGTPTAGSHTYKLNAAMDSGTASTNVGATNPAFLIAEDIGP